MSEENRTPARQFNEVDDFHHSFESISDAVESLLSQLLDRRTNSSKVDGRLNAIIAFLSTQIKMLIQSVEELSERKLTRSTEENKSSKRSRSSDQRSDTH